MVEAVVVILLVGFITLIIAIALFVRSLEKDMDGY